MYTYLYFSSVAEIGSGHGDDVDDEKSNWSGNRSYSEKTIPATTTVVEDKNSTGGEYKLGFFRNKYFSTKNFLKFFDKKLIKIFRQKII